MSSSRQILPASGNWPIAVRCRRAPPLSEIRSYVLSPVDLHTLPAMSHLPTAYSGSAGESTGVHIRFPGISLLSVRGRQPASDASAGAASSNAIGGTALRSHAWSLSLWKALLFLGSVNSYSSFRFQPDHRLLRGTCKPPPSVTLSSLTLTELVRAHFCKALSSAMTGSTAGCAHRISPGLYNSASPMSYV